MSCVGGEKRRRGSDGGRWGVGALCCAVLSAVGSLLWRLRRPPTNQVLVQSYKRSAPTRFSSLKLFSGRIL